MEMMRVDGVLLHVIQVEGNVERVVRLVAIEAMVNTADPARRLFALLSMEADGLRTAARRLRLSNAERDFLLQLNENAGRLRMDMSPAGLRHAIYHLGAPLSRELALMAWADDGDEAGWRAVLDVIAAWTSIALPVSGADVLTLGVEHGEKVGALLRRVEEWWIVGDFKAGRDACLAHLAHLVSEG